MKPPTYIGACGCREWILALGYPPGRCGFCDQKTTYVREDDGTPVKTSLDKTVTYTNALGSVTVWRHAPRVRAKVRRSTAVPSQRLVMIQEGSKGWQLVSSFDHEPTRDEATAAIEAWRSQ